MNTPMTPAQAAQNQNRDQGGRYATKTHAEAALVLDTVDGKPAWPARATADAEQQMPADAEALTDQSTGRVYDTPEAAEVSRYLNEHYAVGDVESIELDEDARRPGSLVLAVRVTNLEPADDEAPMSVDVGVDALDGRVAWVNDTESGSPVQDVQECVETATSLREQIVSDFARAPMPQSVRDAVADGAYPGKTRAPAASEAMAEHTAALDPQQRLAFDERYGHAAAALARYPETGSQGVHDQEIVPAIGEVAEQLGLHTSEVRSVDGVVNEDADADAWEVTSDLFELTATRAGQDSSEHLPGGGYHHEPGEAQERSAFTMELGPVHRVRDAGTLRERVEELEMIQDGKAAADRWLQTKEGAR